MISAVSAVRLTLLRGGSSTCNYGGAVVASAYGATLGDHRSSAVAFESTAESDHDGSAAEDNDSAAQVSDTAGYDGGSRLRHRTQRDAYGDDGRAQRFSPARNELERPAVADSLPPAQQEEEEEEEEEEGTRRRTVWQRVERGSRHRSYTTGLSQSFSMILVTELGDKTFFIAAVMAMRHARTLVLYGALSALVVMTVLSAFLGRLFPALFSAHYTSFAASALFFFFGVQMLRDWWRMHRQHRERDARRDRNEGAAEENQELHEVEMELREHDEAENGDADTRTSASASARQEHRDCPGGASAGKPREKRGKQQQRQRDVRGSNTFPSSSPPSDAAGDRDGASAAIAAVKRSANAVEQFTLAFVSPVLLRAFSLTFLGEWGDRSQIATIALAAHRDAKSVIVGSIAGHALCTGLAVIGGRLLATRIPERTIALIGGVLFIFFGVVSLSGYA